MEISPPPDFLSLFPPCLLQAMQKLDMAREKLQETNEEFETARRHARKAKQNFERVKKERHDRFMNCFEHVANEIDNIYKVIM